MMAKTAKLDGKTPKKSLNLLNIVREYNWFSLTHEALPKLPKQRLSDFSVLDYRNSAVIGRTDSRALFVLLNKDNMHKFC